MGKMLPFDGASHAPVLPGKRVYRPYSPAQAGIVLEDNGYIKSGLGVGCYRILSVKWLNGKTTYENSGNLQDFDSLIEDHQKKLQTHLTTASKLDKLSQ